MPYILPVWNTWLGHGKASIFGQIPFAVVERTRFHCYAKSITIVLWYPMLEQGYSMAFNIHDSSFITDEQIASSVHFRVSNSDPKSAHSDYHCARQDGSAACVQCDRSGRWKEGVVYICTAAADIQVRRS